MDDACTELDKLVVNCEFENQQYVKLIELEKQHLERYQQEIGFNSKETTRLHAVVAQLEDDIKQCNRQFTLNKANIESLKTTSHVLSEHAAAMSAKLELLQEKRRKQRMDHACQIQHYKEVWERYKISYEKYPMAAELKNLESENKQLTERVRDKQLEIETMKKQGVLLEERSYINRMDLKQFIVKVAELQVKRMLLVNKMDALRCRNNTTEKSQVAASVETNTHLLTAMQLEDHEENMDSREQSISPQAVEMTSPMITVFSERDDTFYERMEDSAQESETTVTQELPTPEWVNMYQQRPEQKPFHLQQSRAQNNLKDTDMDSECNLGANNPNQQNVTENVKEPDEPMVHAEDAVQDPPSIPYVSYTKRNNSGESVNIHLHTSVDSKIPRQINTTQQGQSKSSSSAATSTVINLGNTNFASTDNLPLSAPVSTASRKNFNIPSAPQIRIPTFNSRSLPSLVPQNITPSVSQNVPSLFVPHHIAQPVPRVQHPQVLIPKITAPTTLTVKTPEIPLSTQLSQFAKKITSPRLHTGAVTSKESTKQMQLSPQEKPFQRPIPPAVSIQMQSQVQVPGPHSAPMLRSPMVMQSPRFVVPAVSVGPRPAVIRQQFSRPPVCQVPQRSLGPPELPKPMMYAAPQAKGPQHIANSPARMMTSPSQLASSSPTATEDMEECSSYFLPMTKEGSPHVTTISHSPDKNEQEYEAFDMEKHRQRLAEFKKSPGQHTFVAARRMFPYQNRGHTPVGGAGDHGNTEEGDKGHQTSMDGQMQMTAWGDHALQRSDGKQDNTASLFNFADKKKSADSPNVNRFLAMFGFGSTDEAEDGVVNFSLENNAESDNPSTDKPLFAMDFSGSGMNTPGSSGRGETGTEEGSGFSFNFGFGASTDAEEVGDEPAFKIIFGPTSPGIGDQKGAGFDGNYLSMFGNDPDVDSSQESSQGFKINFSNV